MSIGSRDRIEAGGIHQVKSLPWTSESSAAEKTRATVVSAPVLLFAWQGFAPIGSPRSFTGEPANDAEDAQRPTDLPDAASSAPGAATTTRHRTGAFDRTVKDRAAPTQKESHGGDDSAGTNG